MTTVAPPVGTRRGRGLSRLRRAAVGWGFALPFTLLFVVFMAGPVLASLLMSFTDLRSADLRDPLGVNLVGAENYRRLLHDELFLRAVGNTAVFVLFGVPLTMVAGLAAALALNSGLTRLRSVFRVGYYLPVVTSIVAVAVVWRFLLQPETGPVNNLLRLIGVTGPNWLYDTRFALPALIVMAAWRNLGYQMVIFLAGLQAIPQTLYEAARLDGASTWQQFRYVTLPALRPTLLFVGVIATIGYLQFFEESYVMTRGGPLNSTLSVAYYVYDQFGFGNYGYASALSYALFLAIVLLSIAWFRLLSREDGR